MIVGVNASCVVFVVSVQLNFFHQNRRRVLFHPDSVFFLRFVKSVFRFVPVFYRSVVCVVGEFYSV